MKNEIKTNVDINLIDIAPCLLLDILFEKLVH